MTIISKTAGATGALLVGALLAAAASAGEIRSAPGLIPGDPVADQELQEMRGKADVDVSAMLDAALNLITINGGQIVLDGLTPEELELLDFSGANLVDLDIAMGDPVNSIDGSFNDMAGAVVVVQNNAIGAIVQAAIVFSVNFIPAPPDG